MVGRKTEIGRMKRMLNAKKAGFLAVTGRRRIGKTYLIDYLLREHFCFSMTGIQNGGMKEQLINFAVKLAEYGDNSNLGIPKNWQEAFLQLKRYLKTLDTNRKQVIFIDELPWVSSPKSGFLQMLAHFWNDFLSKTSHFILVICGSATSWIQKNILNDPGGLHNRVTETIHLYPFTLSETADFVRSKGLGLSQQEITKIYMALGGVPFYIEKLRKGESFPVAIERICFSDKGPLRNEYQNLYQALFKNADIHLAIVQALATHQNGLSHAGIQKKTGLRASGSYQRAIEELILSDFILETTPFGKKKRGSVYHLVDEYSVFYHRFIKPNSKYTPGIWQQLAAGQSYKIWAGYAFESLCSKHIPAIKAALGIRSVFTQISSLQIQGSAKKEGLQIDLIIDRKDSTINLCEIKFHAAPFKISKAYYQELLSKRQRFIEATGTKKQVFITFITNHGILKNEYASEIVDVEVLLEDLF